jgi:hypothetical protein
MCEPHVNSRPLMRSETRRWPNPTRPASAADWWAELMTLF